MGLRVLLRACVIVGWCLSVAHSGEPKRDCTGVGISVGMLVPRGYLDECYEPSEVFGAMIVTRSLGLEVQYSSLDSEWGQGRDREI